MSRNGHGFAVVEVAVCRTALRPSRAASTSGRCGREPRAIEGIDVGEEVLLDGPPESRVVAQRPNGAEPFPQSQRVGHVVTPVPAPQLSNARGSSTVPRSATRCNRERRQRSGGSRRTAPARRRAQFRAGRRDYSTPSMLSPMSTSAPPPAAAKDIRWVNRRSASPRTRSRRAFSG